jgi:hypothetical protein
MVQDRLNQYFSREISQKSYLEGQAVPVSVRSHKEEALHREAVLHKEEASHNRMQDN